jgi:hypothetical protein
VEALPPFVKEIDIAADKSNGVVRRWYGPFATAHHPESTDATVRRHRKTGRRTTSGALSRRGMAWTSGALPQRVCYAMTFLLFLISLAVLEYIVRRPEAAPKAGWPPLGKRLAAGRPADPAPALTPGLFALGQALDRCGRGPTPGTMATTLEVPGPQADRV